MKNNELRIGNLVLFYNEVVPITGIVKSGFYIGEHGFAINLLDWFQPIKLTEEWLVKLGFVKNDSGFYEQKRFTYHPEHGWNILSQWIKGWVNVAEIKYVHSLQNLYFALTGKELKIKQQ